MTILPPEVAESDSSKSLAAAGLEIITQGKVRNTYLHPTDSDLLLVVATDRLSIFDFVLPVLVPRKGEVLTALTHFWLTHVLQDFKHHLMPNKACDDLKREIPVLPMERSLVVQKVKIPPFEMIFRHHIGGSVWSAYEKNGVVAGQQLPANLQKWAFLRTPLFTPSTKSEKGHDANITVDEYLEEMGELGQRSIQMLMDAYSRVYEHAKRRGVLILDTKFEIGIDEHGLLVIADEVLTPDSSRFTTVEDFERAMKEGRNPVFEDKEPVREWGSIVRTPKGQGIDSLNPEDPEDLEFVAALRIPRKVVENMTERYLNIFPRLTGMSLSQYQKEEMHI